MTVTIEKLDAAGLDANLAALADILHTAVQVCASVGFIWPFSCEDARAFFAGKVRYCVAGGKRVLFATLVDARCQGLARKLMIALEDGGAGPGFGAGNAGYAHGRRCRAALFWSRL